MGKNDARQLDHATLEAMRERAVQSVQEGESPEDVARVLGINRSTMAKDKIFLIVDRGPAHIAKKTKKFVASLGGALQLLYLPPYAPDYNPDELVWKHLLLSEA